MGKLNKALNTPSGLRRFTAWTASKAVSLLARRYVPALWFL